LSNILILAIAQMLSASALTVVVLMGSLVGAALAPRPSLATVPISIAIVAMALTTVPAAMLMRRIGRRAGFIVGALIGAAGGAVAARGVVTANFQLFCAGTILLGSSMAFTQQYRFAAAESVPPELMSRAVSCVLIGALAAALIGPQLALTARSWIAGAEYAGSFATVSALSLMAIAVLTRLRLPKPATEDDRSAPLSTRQLLGRQDFRIAVFASVVAFAVMSFIMTATPVSMHVMDHHSVETTTWVIQSHVLAMYLPSLFSGGVIARFGERNTMLFGGGLLSMCALVSLLGQHVLHYWLGLVALGVGWNLLFVSGTTLLARTFRGADRHRAQAINEFTVFGSQACASLLAGLAVQQIGWLMLNLATVPLLVAMFLAASRLRVEPAHAAPDGHAARIADGG
jgi:MFS family permease